MDLSVATKYNIHLSQSEDGGVKSNGLTLIQRKHVIAWLLHTIYDVEDKYILQIHILMTHACFGEIYVQCIPIKTI